MTRFISCPLETRFVRPPSHPAGGWASGFRAQASGFSTDPRLCHGGALGTRSFTNRGAVAVDPFESVHSSMLEDQATTELGSFLGCGDTRLDSDSSRRTR